MQVNKFGSALTLLSIAVVGSALAQSIVRFLPANGTTESSQIEAVLSFPSSGAASAKPLPAVVLLHSGGGWEQPLTAQYAKALNAAGFITLEPRNFRNERDRKPIISLYLPNVFGALKFLASRADVDSKRIGVAGFSNGGVLAMNSATAWSKKTFGGPEMNQFAAHAPFYPVCWGYSAFMKGTLTIPTLPKEMYSEWTGAPVRIFAGGLDDYDDRDPTACDEMISNLPSGARSQFSVKVYPNATHGWDQPDAEFQERMACKGRGCVNRNVHNPAVTEVSIRDLVEFMNSTLR